MFKKLKLNKQFQRLSISEKQPFIILRVEINFVSTRFLFSQGTLYVNICKVRFKNLLFVIKWLVFKWNYGKP